MSFPDRRGRLHHDRAILVNRDFMLKTEMDAIVNRLWPGKPGRGVLSLGHETMLASFQCHINLLK